MSEQMALEIAKRILISVRQFQMIGGYFLTHFGAYPNFANADNLFRLVSRRQLKREDSDSCPKSDGKNQLLSNADNLRQDLFYDRKIISLLEIMKHFQAWGFLSIIEDLDEFKRIAVNAIKEHGNDCVPEEEWKRKELIRQLNALSDICETLDFKKTRGRIRSFTHLLHGSIRGNDNYVCNFKVIDAELHNLKSEIWGELAERKFTCIANEKSRFFEQEKLFGEDVYDAFPEARGEIKDAGNCLATDLNTAAVFHLMRVIELGLRELAVHLKAKALVKKLRQTQIPIELGTWEEIIITLESKLDELRKLTRSPRREQRIEICTELLKDFRSVKDLWRNKVMHTRANYDAKQAESAFDHVCSFMQKLSKALKTKA